jgi:DNA polymerase-3 subunit beta
LSAGPDAGEITLSIDDVHRLFVTPGFAISTEDTRFYLNSFFLHCAGDWLRAVSTNCHTLILMASAISIAPNLLPEHGDVRGVIIPGRACAEIARLGKKEGVTLRIGTKIVEAHAGGSISATKTIDGTYPFFRRVIVEPSSNTAELDRAPLVAALGRLQAAADAAKAPPLVGFDWKDDEIALRLVREPEAAHDALPAITSGTGHVATRLSQLVGLFASIEAGRVKLDHGGGDVPIRITVRGDNDFVALQMPARW